MSDEPADSLRRELEAAVLKSLTRHMLSPYEATAASVASDLWPLLEAARADERKRIANAIEAEAKDWHHAGTETVAFFASLARGGV